MAVHSEYQCESVCQLYRDVAQLSCCGGTFVVETTAFTSRTRRRNLARRLQGLLKASLVRLPWEVVAKYVRQVYNISWSVGSAEWDIVHHIVPIEGHIEGTSRVYYHQEYGECSKINLRESGYLVKQLTTESIECSIARDMAFGNTNSIILLSFIDEVIGE